MVKLLQHTFAVAAHERPETQLSACYLCANKAAPTHANTGVAAAGGCDAAGADSPVERCINIWWVAACCAHTGAVRGIVRITGV